MALPKDRVNVSNRQDESSVTVIVLNCEAEVETYKKCDVLHVAEFVVPEDASVDDLVVMIWDMMEKQFPHYHGEIECQFLERDMLRATVEIKKLSLEEQLETKDVTPAFALRRLGRMFVVLSEPVMSSKKTANVSIKKTRSDSCAGSFLEDSNSPLRVVTPRSRHTKEETQTPQQECARCSTATGDVSRLKRYDLNDDIPQHVRRVKNLHETYAHILESVMQPHF